ncbi:MAG: hypothetical protein K2N53_02925 [Clostridia bacterium]|nr:hypothetical protein [Clostridia bacterium]
MLRYYYVKQKDRLYVYDNENGFYKTFDTMSEKWVTPAVSFSQVECDNDIDFVEISQDVAKAISNGVSFEEQLKEYLAAIGSV